MLRPMAITLSSALLLAACGSDGQNQQPPPSPPPVPPAYVPPDNAQAPLGDPQRAPGNEQYPPDNPQGLPPNPQGPTAPPRFSGGASMPQYIVQRCRTLCLAVPPNCSESCDDYCDDLAAVSSSCATAADALLTCYAVRGADCRDNGTLRLPEDECRDDLVEDLQVSEQCLDQLFP